MESPRRRPSARSKSSRASHMTTSGSGSRPAGWFHRPPRPREVAGARDRLRPGGDGFDLHAV